MTEVTAVDPLTDLLRLVEREHQRINDLEQEMTALREELADERLRRRALSNRVDEMERSTP